MRFRSENEENFSLDLTPLVDVVFLLLIFFMVSTVFIDFKRQMDISLPSSKSSAPSEVLGPVMVELTIDRQVLLNGEKINLKNLSRLFLEFHQVKKNRQL